MSSKRISAGFVGVLVITLGFHGAVANGHQSGKRPQDWLGLTSMLQAYLDQNREDLEAIMAPLDSLRPYQIELAPDGLDVYWSEGSERVKAPDSLTERIRPNFEKASLMSLQYAPEIVQFLPRGATYSYKGRGIFFLIIHAVRSYGVPECTEALLLEHEKPFGMCWLSLKPENWYVEMSWTFSEHERAAYEKSGK